jgi:hypothetical protein
MRETKKPALMFLSDLQARIKSRRLYLIGEPQLYGDETSESGNTGWPRTLETDLYLAASIGRRALSDKRRWKSGRYIRCEPLYIRPPDALENIRRTRSL